MTHIHVIDGVSIGMVIGGEIDHFWSDMKAGLVRAIEESHGEVSPETVIALIRQSHWCCWLASDGNKLIGFVVGEEVKTEKGIWLSCPFAWVDKDLKATNRLLDTVEQYAKDNSYIGVKWISSKPAFGTFAQRRGYEIRFVEYVKVTGQLEVSDGD